MMDHDLQNVSDADYRRLIAEAYPSPKRDIRAAVMAQVTAEAFQSGKKAKILTPAFRNRFVKYGSIAACFVLLVTLGFRVLPMMTKDAVLESEADFAAPEAAVAAGTAMVTADTAAYDDAETVPETAAAPEENGNAKTEAPIQFKAVLTDSTDLPAEEVPAAEEEIEEAIAVYSYSAEIEADIGTDTAVSTEPETPMLMTAPAPVVEEAPVEEAVVEECVEECVVEEAVAEEPAEELAAPEYYRNAPDKTEGARRMFEYELKLDLYQEVHDRFGFETYDNWMTEHGYTDVSSWSIAEFVDRFHISRERFTELYDAQTESFAEIRPESVPPTYDLDKMYSMDTDITESIAAGNPGCITDELYRN